MFRIAFAGSSLVFALAVLAGTSAIGFGQERKEVKLLNASYDPTRELYRELNAAFTAQYLKDQGIRVQVEQAHGGSGSQAQAVANGKLEADVVTLALETDVDIIRKKGLIADGWQKRLPNLAQPYHSTIVFVVRKGNPKGVKDWPDLIRSGIQVVTPNPKTSGNGQLSFLAAWGSVLQRGQSEREARQFVTELYNHVPVLDNAARAATLTFAERNIGDVHLTWENEAHLEVQQYPGLEIVYPSTSIRAEPVVAWVDANVKKHGTQAVAESYLRFLYSEPAQEIIAKHFYRPSNPEVLKRHAERLPRIELFSITTIAKGWDEAQLRFFAKDGVFDSIDQANRR